MPNNDKKHYLAIDVDGERIEVGGRQDMLRFTRHRREGEGVESVTAPVVLDLTAALEIFKKSVGGDYTQTFNLDQIAGFEVGRENQQLVEWHADLLATGQIEKVVTFFQGDDPPIEQIVDLLRRETVLALKVNDERGIHIATASAHDQTSQGAEAHGGIDGVPAAHGRYTAAIAQMGGDQIRILCRFA